MKEGHYINTVKTICDKLKSTSSTKGKEKILKDNQNNQLFKNVLHFLLNTYIVTGISGAKIKRDVYVMGDYILIQSFDQLANYLQKNNTGRDLDIASCQSYIYSFADPDMRDFISSIITKSLKLGCDSKTINRVYGKDFLPTHEVQQAYSIEKYPLKHGTWFSLSEKQNGVRGSFLGGKIVSRQGKEISGLNHIIDNIKLLGLEDYFIDGELKRKNIDGVSDNENFRIGTGILNSDQSDKSEIEFVIFDMLPYEDFLCGESKDTYKTRKKWLNELKDEIKLHAIKNLEVIDFIYEGTDQSEIDKWLNVMVEQDKEGLMLNKDVKYKCKRHNGILKVKRFYTLDLKIVRVEEGSGRLSGTLGAVVVDYKGNEVNCGSGFTDDQRAELWDCRDKLIGKIVEIKFKEVSQDKKTGLKSLQFPIFVRNRFEKNEVSYN